MAPLLNAKTINQSTPHKLFRGSPSFPSKFLKLAGITLIDVLHDGIGTTDGGKPHVFGTKDIDFIALTLPV